MEFEQLQLVKDRLDIVNALPNVKGLSQHFLVSERGLALLTSQVDYLAHVIEVGAGVGHTSELLAQKAAVVVGVEKDGRFQDVLQSLSAQYPNLDFIIGDILTTKRRNLLPKGKDRPLQIVTNLPFNITEPFLQILTELPYSDATLILGSKTLRTLLCTDETQPEFGRLTLLSEVYFDITHLGTLPPPRPRL